MADIEISERLISFFTFLPLFFISLAVHEFAHAYSANLLGDSTAKNEGRLTLNPIKHIDIIGTIIMPIMSLASGFILIGWAKPVPIDRRNFTNPLKDDAIVSFAGPFSNFLLAVFFFLLFWLSVNFTSTASIAKISIPNILWYGVYLNIFLFLFNLLPIPPLDGSHILFDIFPNKITAGMINYGLYGSIFLLLFINTPLWGYFMEILNFILKFFLIISGLK